MLLQPAAAVNTVEEQRARWEWKRSRTAKELVKTEQKYLEQLDLVTTYFVAILKAKGTLQPGVREAIFGVLESIHYSSQILLLHLERGHLGLGLKGFCQKLELYGHYAENLEQAKKTLQILRIRKWNCLWISGPPSLKILAGIPSSPVALLLFIALMAAWTSSREQLKKNKSFCRFKKLQESRPEFLGWQLEDLLPLPLQRLHEYKYLFRDLMENTSPDCAEFQHLAKAVKSVSEVSQWVHCTIRSHDNAKQLLRVQKLLKGHKTKVLTPGRWYIQEGWLMEVPAKGEEVKRKMFFLFSDILVATKPCHPLHPLNSDKFACQAVYPLNQCTLDKVFGHTQSQGGLLSLIFPHKTLLLMSSNQEDINNWYLNLTTAIRRLQARPTPVHQKEDLTEQPVSSTEAPTVQEMCQDF
ncbi:rho guanine nucleotide exchange factor 39 isoform X1 [Pelodiscus sinensis]|uniref:rho guanine nucleotide exchange factor 39 isoform X1 n=1 Tax=Pelodiscus sinensis TaxID=13735 RepID=UPI0003C44B2A|nr:rho guanine nucleotide exchange factor 39 isoform X2 [Pelodiscus sinensis]|eukprot:XP_014427614.1 rho guanine nucleotide exchange factor 39 isoform X2 [Pelodiscus sinensis]